MPDRIPGGVSSLRRRHEVRLAVLFVGVLVSFLIFLKVAEDVWESESIRWDDSLLILLHAHATPIWDVVFTSVTRLGSPGPFLGALAVVVAFLIKSGCRWDAFYLAVSVLGASALNLIAKVFFHRARPALFVSPAPESTYSFPSAHAMVSAAFCLAVVLLLWHTRWRWIAVVGATLLVGAVGMSRLYLGVHFPSDVLGGWCASAAWVAGSYGILRGRLERSAGSEPRKTADSAPVESPREL